MFQFTWLSCSPATLTELDVRAGLAALVGVQDQETDFEEKAVWGHIKTAHLVEAVAAHHQRNETYSFAHHVDVVNYPIDRCLRGMKKHLLKQHYVTFFGPSSNSFKIIG